MHYKRIAEQVEEAFNLFFSLFYSFFFLEGLVSELVDVLAGVARVRRDREDYQKGVEMKGGRREGERTGR